jgi:DNA gyrase/topoisomerase IV subunit B
VPPAAATAAADAVPEEFTLSTFKDHVKTKGMWAGALGPIIIADLTGAVEAPPPAPPSVEKPRGAAAAAADEDDADPDAANADEDDDGVNHVAVDDDTAAAARAVPAPLKIALVNITRPHTPALLKILDEIIVNATDHSMGTGKVTVIHITFDMATGRFSVFNDGPGIPVLEHVEASKLAGHKVYRPEVAFATFLAGSNIEKDLANVKGGINGLGAKIANVHSLEFTVETLDGATHLFYRQQWRDRLDVRGEPMVVDVRRRGGAPAALPEGVPATPHTRVSFIPAYAALGYRGGAPLAPADAADLDAWVRLRAHQAAAYVGARVAVTYNGERCMTTDVASLGRLLLTPLGEEAAGAIVLSTAVKATGSPWNRHPWHIAVVVLPAGRKAGRRAAAQNMTIVNGVLSNKGSHVTYLKRLLSEEVEAVVRRATKDKAKADTRGPTVAEMLAGIRLVMCGAVPGADWGGQRKDELQVSKDTLERYKPSKAYLKRVGEAVAERILISQGKTTTRVVHDKYTRARHAGRAKKKDTLLFVAEGESAIKLVRAGLTVTRKAAPPGGPSFDWCGIISIQGVVVNAAREVTAVETSGGDTIRVRSARLQNNVRLAALADAFGLQYGRTYETPEELATLNYGRILLCVDQDLDGTGKIAPLVLVWIYLFWPALIRHGRVGRFMTPLIRAFPKTKGPPVEFFYEVELETWIKEQPERAKTHTIKYYKGLASHEAEDVKPMFAPDAFRRSIYMYTMDDTAAELFRVYFGKDPALRKAALITPVALLGPDDARRLKAAQQIPVGRVQLDIDTKLYKLDAIERQLPGAPDGLNPARRKVLAGAMRTGAKILKVFQLGGIVASELLYHHGDASLCATIIHMAQSFIGARKFPLLVGKGQFGSRHNDEAGSPRYISVRLGPLARAAFPPEDRWFLPYVFEDGQRAEPRYFVPVAPLGVLESYHIVSEGWNHHCYGRSLAAVLAVVRAYIGGDPVLAAAADAVAAGDTTGAAMAAAAERWPLPVDTRDFRGEVRQYRGELFSFGFYTWAPEKRTVTVTELPMGLETEKYLGTLSKPKRDGTPNPRAQYIESVDNRSSDVEIELEIVLREGCYEKVCAEFGSAEIDPIEDMLMLRASLRPHLNYYSARDTVLEFGSDYLAALLYWAPLRRDLYRERIIRAQIVASLRIIEEEAVIRYIGIAAELDLAKSRNDDEAIAVLRARGFPPLHWTLLQRPEFTPNDKLRELVTEGPGVSYDYLLNLRERDLVLSAVAKRHEALAAAREALDRCTAMLAEKPFAGASLWLSELDTFAATVEKGIQTGWQFD